MRAWCGQGGVVREDCRFERAQLRPWLDADLLDETPAGAPECEQRVTLPTTAVEREHQLVPVPLSKRMFVHESLELGGHLALQAQRQVGIDPGLEGGQPHLAEPGRLCGAEPGVLEVRICGATPQAKRFAENRRCY